MTAEPSENARPQDVGRRHRAKGAPSRESAELLSRYHRAMRAEMQMVLRDIRPYPRAKNDRPSLADRSKLWDLAIKLARELGAEIDPPKPAELTPIATRREADFG